MKYTSHVMLQYLIQKCNVSMELLHKEMDGYYSQPHWNIKQTPNGRVTEISLLPGAPKPPLPRKLNPPSKSPQRPWATKNSQNTAKVTYKKRRVINTR